jgi:hypothetical protein
MSVDQFQLFSFSNFIKFIKLNANKQITQVPIRSLEDLGWMLKFMKLSFHTPQQDKISEDYYTRSVEVQLHFTH